VDISDVAAAPSLTADNGLLSLTSGSPGNQIEIGNYFLTPYAGWIQMKQPNNAGTTFPLVLNPLGGNVGIGTAAPTSLLSLGGTNPIISTATADTADNALFQVSGGGAPGVTRGSYFNLYGNEYATAGGSIYFYAGNVSTGVIAFGTGNSVTRLKINYDGSIHFAGGSAVQSLAMDTADAADNGVLQIGGGGEVGSARGAYMNICGNEYASAPGDLQLLAGNVSTGDIIFYTGNTVERLKIEYAGNILVNGAVSNGNLSGGLAIKNAGVAASAAVTDGIQLYATDTTDSTSTLSLWLEQAVEDIGTFTPSHKIKVRINGTVYWIQLDAV
jgi:hypothetical protein